MKTHHPQNERIKRRYLEYLKEADGQAEASLDAVAKALSRFETYTKHRDFKAFRPEQAKAFKARLGDQLNARTGERLSKATLYSTLRTLRAFFRWLAGQQGYRSKSSLPWLNRAVELNPNYAQAKYSLAWTETLLGQANHGQALTDTARELSPLDPLLYGMLGVRALSHMVLDQPAEAALWGEQAARSPRAHALIELIAAVAHGMNNDDARAGAWVKSARARHPGLSADDFLSAFPFHDRSMRQLVRETLERLIQ